jgi:flagellar basal-body rod protein FlgC
MNSQLSEPRVVGIHQDTKEPRSVFDPTHPDADKNGNVKMPNVQVMTEMVNMIAATRAYEANATALNEAKNMAIKSLEIGR